MTPGRSEALVGLYESQEVSNLLRVLQEATRATPQGGVERYIPPSGGERAEADYHHFVFGQRGSGKSSLLRHLQRQKIRAGRATAWIDQEVFSNLDYPDVLVSAVEVVVRSLMESVKAAESPRKLGRIERLSYWIRRKPTPSGYSILVDDLTVIASEFERLKYAPLDQKIEWVISNENSTSQTATAGVHFKILSLASDDKQTSQNAVKSTEVTEGTKEQYLERVLLSVRELLARASKEIGGGFVFVDDLYQLRRSHQPLVLGYLHRLLKDSGLWLKIGSIRYSTVTFKQGDPPRGMQVGHDAQEVALDRGLRHVQATQDFLEKIMVALCEPIGVDFPALWTNDARRRLVLAAGGVARDYLRIAAAAIDEARNRGVGPKSGSDRVTVEDVNKAAGTLSPSKFDDLREDEPREAAVLEALVRRLTEFCRSTRRAYFLTPTSNKQLSDQVNKLQHLRFTHLLEQSETVPNEGSERFDVWLLDVAELSAQRATQGMDFLGWSHRESRRNRRLIFDGSVEPSPEQAEQPLPFDPATDE